VQGVPLEVVVEEDKTSSLSSLRDNVYRQLLKCAKRIGKTPSSAGPTALSSSKAASELVLIELEEVPTSGGVDTQGTPPPPSLSPLSYPILSYPIRHDDDISTTRLMRFHQLLAGLHVLC
jgi:hypothetical protein